MPVKFDRTTLFYGSMIAIAILMFVLGVLVKGELVKDQLNQFDEACMKEIRTHAEAKEAVKKAAEKDIAAIKKTANEETAKKERLEKTLHSALESGNSIYATLGSATVQLNSGCHGVLVLHKNEVVILTAAHCTDEEAVQYRLSQLLMDAGNGRTAYGFLDDDKWFATGKKLVVDDQKDLAYFRGMRSLQKREIRDRALRIAENTPEPKRVIMSTHQQEHCWGSSPYSQDCKKGKMLMPNYGFSRGFSDNHPRNFFSYSLPVYPGDSGSGLLDEESKLVGILSAVESDAGLDYTKEISSIGSGPRTIRTFLESTWKPGKPGKKRK